MDDLVARSSAFFGSLHGSPNGGVTTCLLHDIIHTAAKSAHAVSGRVALTAHLKAAMSGSATICHVLTDVDAQLN